MKTLFAALLFACAGAPALAENGRDDKKRAKPRAEATLPNTYGFTLAPQQMLGASLAYNFSDNLKLEINATNLTNHPNWTSDGAMFHGEPRSVSASLSYTY